MDVNSRLVFPEERVRPARLRASSGNDRDRTFRSGPKLTSRPETVPCLRNIAEVFAGFYHRCCDTRHCFSKLRNHLDKPTFDEPWVVTFCAEFGSCWRDTRLIRSRSLCGCFVIGALHVDLTRPKTTLSFLQRVDKFVTHTVAGFKGSGPWSVMDEHRLFREFVYLDTFRSQLKEVLVSYELPTDLCDQDTFWFRFLVSLCGCDRGWKAVRESQQVGFARGRRESDFQERQAAGL